MRKKQVIDLTPVPPPTQRLKKRLRNQTQSRAMQFPEWYKEITDLAKESWRSFTLLDTNQLYESKKTEYPIVTDPQTGMQVHGRIVEVNWLQQGWVKRNGKNVLETKRIKLPTEGFRESLESRAMQLKESKPRVYNRLKEDGWFDFDGTMTAPTGWPSVQGMPVGTFLAYPPGPLTRQMYLQGGWDMQAKCFEIYNHYGVAHGAVETMANFIIGDGVRITAKDGNDDAQKVWDEFEERVEFQPGLPTECMMLSVNGENLWHIPECQVDSKPGFADFISKDPGTCWEIITEPKDIRNIKAYYFKDRKSVV